MRKQNRKCSSSGPQVFVWADGSNRGQVRGVAKMGVHPLRTVKFKCDSVLSC